MISLPYVFSLIKVSNRSAAIPVDPLCGAAISSQVICKRQNDAHTMSACCGYYIVQALWQASFTHRKTVFTLSRRCPAAGSIWQALLLPCSRHACSRSAVHTHVRDAKLVLSVPTATIQMIVMARQSLLCRRHALFLLSASLASGMVLSVSASPD